MLHTSHSPTWFIISLQYNFKYHPQLQTSWRLSRHGCILVFINQYKLLFRGRKNHNKICEGLVIPGLTASLAAEISLLKSRSGRKHSKSFISNNLPSSWKQARVNLITKSLQSQRPTRFDNTVLFCSLQLYRLGFQGDTITKIIESKHDHNQNVTLGFSQSECSSPTSKCNMKEAMDSEGNRSLGLRFKIASHNKN